VDIATDSPLPHDGAECATRGQDVRRKPAVTCDIGLVDGLEAKQAQAVALLASGESISAVAEACGVHRATVHRWRTVLRLRGRASSQP
jgi:DNA invertase Pin-like site-specific DNA recombinase